MLLPFLLVTQFSQLLVGYLLLQEIRQVPSPDWHAVVVCLLCFLLGCGNIFTTLETYYEKLASLFLKKRPEKEKRSDGTDKKKE